MTLVGFLILLLIAAVAGGIGQAVSGYSAGGFLVSVVLGFAGAWIGTWIASQFGLPALWVVMVQGQAFPVVWAIIGAALLTAVVGAVTRPVQRI